ncbi:MAG: FIST N-terminal domain-containing protein [Devosia sp.]
MQIEEVRWTAETGWHTNKPWTSAGKTDLVIYFGNRDALLSGERFADLKRAYPGAHILGGSATATVFGNDVDRLSVVATAIRFDKTTRLVVTQQEGVDKTTSHACGEAIGRTLAAPDLAGVFVLGDGMGVDGSGLTAGLVEILGESCPITGGMTSDVLDFTQALAGADMAPKAGVVAAVGFYGPNIRIDSGHSCGWDAFGPRRRITRADGNQLFELDDKPVLDLYDSYLGEEEKDQTASGVMFPLLISPPDRPQHTVVRAILGMDRANGSMTFAGSMPEGSSVRLMRGNVDRLAMGAADAARQVRDRMPENVSGEQLALMVTCIGRFLLMGERAVEEIAFARDELGPDVHCMGFYAYGEISPAEGACGGELHNQTMTIVALSEIDS